MALPPKSRKSKATKLKETDWKPYKNIIIDLHVRLRQPLPKVREYMEKELGFVAG